MLKNPTAFLVSSVYQNKKYSAKIIFITASIAETRYSQGLANFAHFYKSLKLHALPYWYFPNNIFPKTFIK